LDHISSGFQERTCCVFQFKKLQFWSMFGSHFKHVWITFQARLDHISSTFQERTCCVTKFQNSCVPITFKAILEHVWITFQAYLDHILSMFQAHLDDVSRTNMLCYLVSKFMCRSKCFECAPDELQMCSRDASLMLQMCFRCAPEMLH
jgi:hypothetical protein